MKLLDGTSGKKLDWARCFLKKFTKTFGYLQNSSISAAIYRNFCRRLLRRFPYAIFYEYEQPAVIVYGVFDMSAHPEVGKIGSPKRA